MSHYIEPSKCIILRVRILEGSLVRNVAKFGSMSPYLEFSWNDEKRKTKISSNGHLNPVWDECFLLEAAEQAQLQITVYHSSILFTFQEIASATLSVEELSKGKIKEWICVYYEGLIAGKILMSATMYEEKRSEQSTHNTSYATVDLKEEYIWKLNELELEKEELEFMKRKYKRKAEKFNREERIYQAKVTEIIKRTTPKHTEESSSDELCDFTESGTVIIGPNDSTAQEDAILKKEKALLHKEKATLLQLKDQVEIDLERLRREQHNLSTHRKVVCYSQDKLNETSQDPRIRYPRVTKSTTEEKLSVFSNKILSDWQTENIKNDLREKNRKSNEQLMHVKLDMGNHTGLTNRAATPKSSEFSKGTLKFRAANYSTGKLVFND